MAASVVRQSHLKTNAGFTLIEVLVAMVILSIALTTIIKVTSQNIKDTFYVNNKAEANWLGNETMNEAIAGVLPLTQEQTIEKKALGKTWLIKAVAKATPHPKIAEIDVEVYKQPENIKLISLIGYRYAS